MMKKTIKSRKPKIASAAEYERIMARIDLLMKKGSAALTEGDVDELQVLVKIAEDYEDHYISLPRPDTLLGMIELKMFHKKMNQKEMAEFLGISPSKFSQILNQKREPDVEFLKVIYHKLHLDPKFILDHA
ncbi:helix-turn-helix transcriptional regulator [Chitinophaga sp. YIM B06452]|uniref:helix-turn-helix transcriptional regulator n=1 Tax=Chitinophaga sp. YIM B06452 TaxID=3082158 RepID=UPI0031FE5A64